MNVALLCLLLMQIVCVFSHGSLFPNIRLLKHSSIASCEYLQDLKDAPFNHEYAGFSKQSDEAPCSSFRVLHTKSKIGEGKADFDKASKYLHSFEMINSLGWAEMVTCPTLRPGDVIGTLVNCYKLVWSLNPCRVTSVRRDNNFSEVAFSTLSGHLIAGEERFRVTLDPDDNVYFSLFSFTKGASSGPGILGIGGGIVGKIAMPFIRPLQRTFFKNQLQAMSTLMREERLG